MCVVNISLITDYDSGLHGNVEPVSHSEVIQSLGENLGKLQTLLVKFVESIPDKRATCKCAETLCIHALSQLSRTLNQIEPLSPRLRARLSCSDMLNPYLSVSKTQMIVDANQLSVKAGHFCDRI